MPENNNCLEGRACPSCKQEDRFDVTGTSTFRIVDEGTEYHSDVEYDDSSYASCPECGWAGNWGQTDKSKFNDHHQNQHTESTAARR